jgi:chromosomal replication initiation ATPase DnaA
MEISTTLFHYMSRMTEYIRLEIEIGNIKYGSPIENSYRAYCNELIKNKINLNKHNFDIKKIFDIVCNYFEVNEKEIKSDRRDKRISDIRKIFSFLCKQCTEATLYEIGRLIKRNHSTVIRMLEITEKRIKWDYRMNTQIVELTDLIIAG